MIRRISIVVAGLLSLCGYYWLLPVQNNQTFQQESKAHNSPNPQQHVFVKIRQANQRINALSPNNQAIPTLNFMDQARLNADVHQYLNAAVKNDPKPNKGPSSNKRSHK
ncbi:MAG: hypothetical protein ACK5L8_00715 [Marinicella pacifica]